MISTPSHNRVTALLKRVSNTELRHGSGRTRSPKHADTARFLIANLFNEPRNQQTAREQALNRDQAYGALIFVVSLGIATFYLFSLFPSYFALPTWLAWWAIALPVILAVLAVLVICMWIGWVMLTTPPPPSFEEPVPEPAQPTTNEKPSKAQ